MEKVFLPYGEKTIELNIPRNNFMGSFFPDRVQINGSEKKLIKEAIYHPIGTPRLSTMVEPGMNVVIIADDKTRPTPVNRIFPIILDELHKSGIPDKDISIIFALGTHIPMSKKEMEERAGVVSERIRLFNSEYKDPEGIIDCGKSPDGVKVFVDKRVAEADFKIGIGSIMPHPECGWGGGAKIIYPGVASEETVTAFHLSYASVDWNTYGSDKAPVRLNMEKWVDNVGLDFIVNTIITADNRVYKAVAGDYRKAHRMGIKYGQKIYSVTLPKRAEIVIITSFRADDDFWLASKAIFAGELVIREGGTLILVSPCPGGLGPHPEYADYTGLNDWKTLLQNTLAGKTNQPIAVSSAVALAKMRKRFDISIVSGGLSSEVVKKMQFQYFTSVDKALSSAMMKFANDPQIAVIPYGISTLPQIESH